MSQDHEASCSNCPHRCREHEDRDHYGDKTRYDDNPKSHPSGTCLVAMHPQPVENSIDLWRLEDEAGKAIWAHFLGG